MEQPRMPGQAQGQGQSGAQSPAEEEWSGNDGGRKVVFIVVAVAIIGFIVAGILYSFKRNACAGETDPNVRASLGCPADPALRP